MNSDTTRNRVSVSPPAERGGRARIRVTNACKQCQQLKRRCDGLKPSCQHCLKLNKPCEYVERRGRGVAKRKNDMTMLEERLMRIEASLKEQSTEEIPALDEAATQLDHHSIVDQAAPSGPQIHPFIQTTNSHLERVSPAPASASEGDSNAIPLDQNLPSSGSGPSNSIQIFSTFATEVHNNVQKSRRDLDRGPFQWKIFAQLPVKLLVLDLILQAMPSLPLQSILYPRDLLQNLPCNPPGLTTDGSNEFSSVPEWALTNSLFANAMRLKTALGSLKGLSPMIWGYFKNAFSVFPELVIHTSELPACEALVSMAMFMHGTADVRVALQLTAAATNLAYCLDLRSMCLDSDVGENEVERYRRLFWTTYLLNADILHKYDVPSPVHSEKMLPPLPQEVDIGDGLPGYYRKLAEISIIQCRLDNALSASRSLGQTNGGVLETARSVLNDLQGWRKSLPDHLQHSNVIQEHDFAVSVMVLHMKYFSCAIKVYTHISRGALFGFPALEDITSNTPGQNTSNTRLSFDMVMARNAALETMNLFQLLSLQPFAQIWELLCYPLAATLLLLSCILSNPEAPESKNDVASIRSFIEFLGKLCRNGNDLLRALNGCIDFLKLATYAIEHCEIDEHPTGYEEMFTQDEVEQKIELLRDRLGKVVDFMHLAQGLLSNVPKLRREIVLIFSGVVDVESVDGEYGAFVPEVLKSSTHNFTFAA
ncbi:hypothetical protein BU24DRAFT_194872 [Aaosphaeria arxii CBS 175.79]|uniref:Zn(2)-C6 fungal-type domain-containing protein n=1 Tax=Aaosphaeria arxii CBS 175.79 TaxID=1450172 RepID=A0A6A5XSJ4_9PLEO|nr:uncharacterized protein BU24DRAFT_194872 [Aaosphaeria arxii CBS 175.79]KAF2016152.1 hypothetical protein BU24DRAFT_194872 [Aaosphaeria arxii CBS 175.79]